MKKKPKNNKVAIIACYSTGLDAPFEDETFDIWTLNHGVKVYRDRRIDKWFDLHNWYNANYSPEYLDWVLPNPPYEIVDTKNYPYTEIMERYGYLWSNSIPMMLAYAGYLGYKYIYLFGAERREFANTPEMGYSLYHVCGMLRAEGRKVYFANSYVLDDSAIYGLQDLSNDWLPAGFRRKEKWEKASSEINLHHTSKST